MISAKELVKVADANIQSPCVPELEKIVKAAAEQGRFFVKLWEGKPQSKDVQLMFVHLYDVETLYHVTRLGYLLSKTELPDGVARLYIGWGFTNLTEMNVAIRHEKD